jgi:CTP:phosphocholine cytidylyltransferase-like protein/thiamine kinase-like enzyme
MFTIIQRGEKMNRQEYDILQNIYLNQFENQRILAKQSGHSLGIVNRSLKSLTIQGYIDEQIQPTNKTIRELREKSPKNAIILAAGFGMRMVPINTQYPKALIEVDGQPIIERIINQLNSIGVKDIYIVVGYMKEQFEYLIDEYKVKLIVNEKYAEKNNLHSLRLAADYLSNTYIIPCDIWCDKNPFHRYELYSWYMVSDLVTDESNVRVNRKAELVKNNAGGNQMVGITYLVEEDSRIIKERLIEYDNQKKYDNSFWEETLYSGEKMIVQANVVHSDEVVEINTYEQLRELDDESAHLNSDAIYTIANVLKVNEKEITDIQVLKKGMTNRSFSFVCRNKKYIMRIPGEGTDQLINRKHEADVYHTLEGKGICDDPIYINSKNGYKITKYLEGVRTCDCMNQDDLIVCMKKLKEFHDMDLKVNHTFNIFEQIQYYEELWDGTPSIYRDYKKTKDNVLSLKSYIEEHRNRWCLTHIDAVPDNFLFYDDGMQLTDWEYSGMQDPHVDIAMFCIYSLYDRRQIDDLIDIYFDGKCERNTRIKIYCYIAVCGLLWSNWCEYKRKLGVEFGEYSLCQYRYAKEYYKIVKEELTYES